MIPSNDNSGGLTITIESGDGEMAGLYLACLTQAGTPEPIKAEIFGTKGEAFDFARDLMRSNPHAILVDCTDGGAA